jgi:hypothetical protein
MYLAASASDIIVSKSLFKRLVLILSAAALATIAAACGSFVPYDLLRAGARLAGALREDLDRREDVVFAILIKL